MGSSMWAREQVKRLSTKEVGSGYKLEVMFASMSVAAMNYWLSHFILEARVRSTLLIVYTSFAVGYNGV